MAGRKTKLTPEVQEKIVTAIRAGNYAYVAAEYAGISERTFFRWFDRGREEKERLEKPGTRSRKSESKFWQFWQAIKSAEAQAEAIRVSMITKASKETWQAAAWWLERKFPDRWARKEKREISGPDGGPIQTQQALPDLSGLSNDELEQLAAIASRLAGGD